jgi:putative flippase GtrA
MAQPIYATLSRYLTVGVLSNVVLYLIYIAITRFPVPPTLAMTIVYAIGIIGTFHFNRTWSFRSEGAAVRRFFGYCVVYGLAYLLQLTIFIVLYHLFNWVHELVQAIAIVAVALFIFTCLRLWVFRPEAG